MTNNHIIPEEKIHRSINAEEFLAKIIDKDGTINLSKLKKMGGGGTHDIYRSEKIPDILLKIMKHTIGKDELLHLKKLIKLRKNYIN